MEIVIIVLGLLGGIAVGIQTPVINSMGKLIGGTAAIFMVHFSGAVIAAVLLALRGGEDFKEFRSLPWYMIGSGMFGVILFPTISLTIPKLGATAAVSLIIIGQLLAGLIIDHFGWFGVPVHQIDATRIIAVMLLMAGGYLMAR